LNLSAQVYKNIKYIGSKIKFIGSRYNKYVILSAQKKALPQEIILESRVFFMESDFN